MLITSNLVIEIKNWISVEYKLLSITEIINHFTFSKICNHFSLHFLLNSPKASSPFFKISLRNLHQIEWFFFGSSSTSLNPHLFSSKSWQGFKKHDYPKHAQQWHFAISGNWSDPELKCEFQSSSSSFICICFM